MKCERCGCVILIGEACIGGDGSYHHEDPQTCIKALAIARDWSRNEARRLAAMVCAMSPVVRAARIVRVRMWQVERAARRTEQEFDVAQLRLEVADARLSSAITACLRGEGR